ncbi:hypothetical protein C349_06407 [Cryptococcus neoformans var. grubii Br795]|uniref:Uncharacterized protein n=1 Tax=Cryptococcus neoformans Tu259-1 TaxID=1230072 RepID=A0A854QAQ0_CRYNE|nr:hypothetical protein C353_06334 [Cryptococcus neoformans var. grubii AD1-83a]OXG11406.1 hypothetical protein C361_06511 [Cryptococcus neoformans var. grubii Tu259-1]OXG46994.1 hypothetical protein C354_06320 [Cryptococcus neoformans var. grubii MW-RSA1955]OXG50566.1 hypothetical protein C352_06339 [Cryptococcus neoformans var. grubii CHC193]OXG57435.1 hypothetical protein C351_06365 [Cryptococcus neoformans var. grubii c8]OXG73840.1 hypothetical protein C349_06407 [Cryptococcus neoformans v
MVDLGAPIGSHQSSNIPASEQTGFNSGVGGEHASSGIPKGTPIADQFMGGHSSGARGTTTGVGSKLDNSLDHYSGSELTGATGTGHHSSGVRSSAATGAGAGAGAGTLGSSGKEAVSGQYAGSGTKDALTGQTGHTTGAGVGPYGDNLSSSTGVGSHSSGAQHSSTTGSAARTGESAVGGAYVGGAAQDGLTGKSKASTIGEGVGPYGENLPHGTSSSTTTGHHGARDAALASTAGGALAGDKYAHSKDKSLGTDPTSTGVSGTTSGTGVGPSGGAGGHYGKGAAAAGAGVGAIGGAGVAAGLAGRDGTSHTSGTTTTTGQHGSALGAGEGGISGTPIGPGAGDGLTGAGTSTGVAGVGSGYGSGAGAGAVGAAGAGAGSGLGAGGAGAGKYGRAQPDQDRGAPLSDPKDLDTGGPHSLVYQESTGKYVHRRELEGDVGNAESNVKNTAERRI